MAHAIDLPDWAVERGSALNAFSTLAPRTALINIDMQSVFLGEDEVYGNVHGRDIVPAINRLSQAFRAIAAPVIWTRQTHTFDGANAPAPWQYDLSEPVIAAGVAALQAGTPSQALYPAMQVAPGDIVLDKYRYGALSCPAGALARALKTVDAQMVILTGVLTNCCCETTAREAHMAGYKVIVVSDATATLTDAEHNAALLNLRLNFADVRTTDEVVVMAQTGVS